MLLIYRERIEEDYENMARRKPIAHSGKMVNRT
jgi:hypothetical protein